MALGARAATLRHRRAPRALSDACPGVKTPPSKCPQSETAARNLLVKPPTLLPNAWRFWETSELLLRFRAPDAQGAAFRLTESTHTRPTASASAKTQSKSRHPPFLAHVKNRL